MLDREAFVRLARSLAARERGLPVTGPGRPAAQMITSDPARRTPSRRAGGLGRATALADRKFDVVPGG